MPAHKGSGHHLAVLSEDAVREARRDHRTGQATASQLAARYGVSDGAMRRAINGQTWKHLSEPTETADAA